MITEGLYTFSEIQAIIKESNEFKPKKGVNVERDNARNNEKAVDDIMKETEKLEVKAKKEERKTNPELEKDLNKTTLDLDFAYEPSDDYKERVKAQVHGFPSKQNEETTDIEKNDSLDFEGNKSFYEEQSEKSKNHSKLKSDIKHSGLTSRELDKENFKDKKIFKENKTMKRLHFKNTRFLSESQMLSKVPEDYKVDGNIFLMKDSVGSEFIVECVVDEQFNYTKFNVTHKPTKEAINEEFKRMEKLYEYKSSDYNTGTSTESRKTENDNVATLLETIKNLQSQK